MITKIYTLASSRNINVIRYVGKTKQSLKRRLSGHINDAKRANKHNYRHNHNWNWINKELSEGYKIIIEELDSTEEESWEYLEQYWIAQLKCWGFDLCNLTLGGDGNKGQIFSKESLEKRSKSLKGRIRTKEERIAISKGSIGKILTKTHKKNVQEAIITLQGKSVLQYTKDGVFIKSFRCITEAAKEVNAEPGNIIKCCKGDPKHKTCKGYVWRYQNNEYIV